MCGIGLVLSFPAIKGGESDVIDNASLNDVDHRLSQALARRGPDVPYGRLSPVVISDDKSASMTLHTSVLHMRGQCPIAQPISFPIGAFLLNDNNNDREKEVSRRKCALCWNGECYTYAKAVKAEMEHEFENDNNLRCHRGDMVELISSMTVEEEQSDTILVTELLAEAIATSQQSGSCEHEAISNAIGRIHGEFAFILSIPSSYCVYYGRDCLGRRSLLVNKSFPGVIVLSSVAIGSLMSNGQQIPNGNDWEELPPGIVYRIDIRTGYQTSLPLARVVNIAILNILSVQTDSAEAAAEVLLNLLDRAVQRRVLHAPLPKLQSTDDASVAVLFSGGIDSVVLTALCHRHVPSKQQIDLINVSFYADSDDIGNKSTKASPDRLAAILSYLELVERFPERKWRFISIDVPYLEVLEHEAHILELISPLDSIMDFNIATAFWFAGRGKGRVLHTNEIHEAMQEIINSNDTSSTRQHEQPLLRFAALGNASNGSSEVCATKFSAEANATFAGKAQRSDNNGIVTSQAKVLISGVGADEQMAGYGRHKSTYNRGGYDALRIELQMEVDRLWKRNLGRDDRCLSDHGKECRFPYLDEDVMAYLSELPVEMKCDMMRPLGEGDKLILRIIARTLGMHSCSTLVKRAIQFGSRIAKVSDVKRFGSGRQAKGQTKIIADKSRELCEDVNHATVNDKQ
jgi:asparagine synthetase B (glutamine-hydrolysing)